MYFDNFLGSINIHKNQNTTKEKINKYNNLKIFCQIPFGFFQQFE